MSVRPGSEDDRADLRKSLELDWRIQHMHHLEGLKVLCGGIANDLNNHLMIIAGNVDLLQQQTGSEPSLSDRLAIMKEAVRRASGLTFQMLSYIGRGDQVMESVDLRRIVMETEKLLQLEPERRAVLEIALEKVPTILADVSSMVHLVTNMMENLADSVCNEKGTAGISLFSSHLDKTRLQKLFERDDMPVGEYVCLKVSDNGCGIHRQTLLRIFSPFGERSDQGSGFGMAGTLDIIRSHNGSLEVVQGKKGRNSIALYFPSEKSLRGGDCGTSERPAEKTTGSTVLVVDDDPTVLKTTGELLESLGHEPLLASDGCEAIEFIRTSLREIDCVLLDLNMPALTGKQTFSIIRELAPDLPVIMSSGYLRAGVTREFKSIGIDGFLQKPYDLAGLDRVLGKVLKDPERRCCARNSS